MTDPGWYYAAGDPAGTFRWWNGVTWVGEPTAPQQQPVQQAAQPQTEPAYSVIQRPLGEDIVVQGGISSKYSVSTPAAAPRQPTKPLSEGPRLVVMLASIFAVLNLAWWLLVLADATGAAGLRFSGVASIVLLSIIGVPVLILYYLQARAATRGNKAMLLGIAAAIAVFHFAMLLLREELSVITLIGIGLQSVIFLWTAIEVGR